MYCLDLLLLGAHPLNSGIFAVGVRESCRDEIAAAFRKEPGCGAGGVVSGAVECCQLVYPAFVKSSKRSLDLGFRRDHVLLVTLDPTHSGYKGAQLSRAYQELLRHLEAIPGVRSATICAASPISGAGPAGL